MTLDAVGGVYTYAVSLARMLCKADVRVHLATMGPPPRGDQAEEALAIEGLELHVSDFDLEWMDDPWDDVDRACDWLLDLERQLAPDIVHLNGFVHGRVPFRAPVISVGHSCVCSWWRAVHGCEAPSSWNRYRDEVRSGLARVSSVVAPTAAMMGELIRDYGPFKHARVIPNGTEVEPPAGAKDLFFLASGRLWDPAKNMAMLDRVAKRLPWPVFIAGSEVAPGGERSLVRNSNKLGSLPRREMQRWMSRAPVLIHPALYEPFGLVPLEAAAAGAALLLADIPSLREVWGSAALYFSPHDENELADLARFVATERRVRMELARRAWLRALRLSIERVAGTYLQLYRELLRAEQEVQRS
jgi:glycosyltransferase involved in cell wall biosynthesis